MKFHALIFAAACLGAGVPLRAQTPEYVTGFVRGGANPAESIPAIAADGTVYFTTRVGGRGGAGGAIGDGTLMRITPGGVRETLIHFDTSEGPHGLNLRNPSTGVLFGPGGDDGVYGVCHGGAIGPVVPDVNGNANGGGSGLGGIFRYDRGTGLATRITHLPENSTVGPTHLMLASDGSFYGMSESGGSATFGDVFRLSPVTAGNYEGSYTYTQLAAFTGRNATVSATEGSSPEGRLTERTDGGVKYLYGVLGLSNLPGTTTSVGRVFRFAIPPLSATSVTLLHVGHFTADFQDPAAGLTLAPDGTLYGTTNTNTGSRWGALYKVDATPAIQLIRYFDNGSLPNTPMGPMLWGADGHLYGAARNPGTGSIFRMNPSTGVYSSLVTFTGRIGATSGENAYGVGQRADGSLICLTAGGGKHDRLADTGGVVVRLSGTGAGPWTYQGLVELGERVPDFSPSDPRGGLVPLNGLLCGTSYRGGLVDWDAPNSGGAGTIYSYNPATGAVLTLHRFADTAITGNGGWYPECTPLVRSDGFLYGTTTIGTATSTSPAGGGTIWRYRPANGATPALFETLASFSGGTAATATAAAGDAPRGQLLDGGDGYLYGTTRLGGAGDFGTVFRLNLSTNAVQTLVHFTGRGGAAPGSEPLCGLTAVRNASGVATVLYGVTSSGNVLPTGSESGVLFSITPSGTYTHIYSFNTLTNASASGYTPHGALVRHSNGFLYGTTTAGGLYGGGTLFGFDPAGGTLGAVFHFNGNASSGRNAEGTLTEGPDGALYGTTRRNFISSTNQNGTLYRFATDTGTYTLLGAFQGIRYPEDNVSVLAGSAPGTAPLVLYNGDLYGTTPQLSDGLGGIYRIRFPSNSPVYDAWRATHFGANWASNPTLSGDNADPDKDGISNLLEYMTDSMPTTGSTPPLTLSRTGRTSANGTSFPGIAFSYWRRDNPDPGQQLTLQYSDNLLGWTDVPLTGDSSNVNTPSFNHQLSIIGGIIDPEEGPIEFPECVGNACRYLGFFDFALSPQHRYFRLKAIR